MITMLTGKKYAGAYSLIFTFSNLSLSMYALSFASYFISLFGFGNERVVALVVLTISLFLTALELINLQKCRI